MAIIFNKVEHKYLGVNSAWVHTLNISITILLTMLKEIILFFQATLLYISVHFPFLLIFFLVHSQELYGSSSSSTHFPFQHHNFLQWDIAQQWSTSFPCIGYQFVSKCSSSGWLLPLKALLILGHERLHSSVGVYLFVKSSLA